MKGGVCVKGRVVYTSKMSIAQRRRTTIPYHNTCVVYWRSTQQRESYGQARNALRVSSGECLEGYENNLAPWITGRLPKLRAIIRLVLLRLT